MARAVAHAHATDHASNDAQATVEPGPGEQALKALLANGRPDPKKVVKVIDAHRGERDALFALLHQSLGNAYVQEVVKAMGGLRVDKKRKEVAAGDPSNPDADSFVASKDGAQWRAAGGDFTGTAGKHGLDATYRIDDDDAIVADIDAKKKEGTVGWQRDGETQGELYADWSEKERREVGVRREWELENGATATGGIRHVQNKAPHDELAYLDGLRYGAPSGDREKELADQRRGHEKASSTELYGAYEHGDTRFDGGLGMSGNELAGSANVRTRLGPNDTLQAGVRRDLSGNTVSAKHVHSFEDGGRLTTSGWLRNNDEGTTGKLSAAYRNGDTQLDASYARGHDYNAYHFGVRQQLSREMSVYGSLDHIDSEHGDQTRGHLGATYTSPNLVGGLDLDAGKGDRDYLGLRGSVAGQLAPNWYGSAFGGATYESGHQTTGHLGASLTFTPSQKTALTLAGVLDQDGSLETRLQFDVFRDRVSNVAQLTRHQRDALFSIFLSYTQGDPSRRILDDRYGRPDMSSGLNNSGTIQAGIRIKF